MIAKKAKMSVAFYVTICAVSASLWLHVQFWTPIDIFSLPCKFWVCLISSVLSDILLYCCGLALAYRTIEISTAYPMMRSLPLIFTALITTVAGWGAPLQPLAICGLLVVFCGCLMMPLKKFSDFNLKNYFDLKMFFILMVALGTTGYTIFDSEAQRAMREVVANISKPVISMTFYSTRGILLTSTGLIMTMLVKSERQAFFNFFRERNFFPIVAGLCASLTYITVLVAMNYVSNVTFVQVFRQVGLILVLFGGIFFFKEKCTLPKISGVAFIICGLILTVI